MGQGARDGGSEWSGSKYKVELISCRISYGLRGRACEQRQGAAGSMDVLFTEMGKVLGKVLGGASLRVTLGVLFRT